MRCPFCSIPDTRVIDSREAAEGLQVRRRRECLKCSERFTTYEMVELSYPRVIKNNGSMEQFNAEKLKTGLLKALEKRPVRNEALEIALKTILSKIRNYSEREIPAPMVGELVMQELKGLDPVAYVRFASVYRHFKDIEEFRDEILKLEQERAYDK
ncbi:MAG: transcriptional regulator NrdR [Gammaproteobacteria bacterium]